MPALQLPMIPNQKRKLPAQPVVRLYEERETSLDREIAVEACAGQTPWVKLMAHPANEFPNQEK